MQLSSSFAVCQQQMGTWARPGPHRSTDVSWGGEGVIMGSEASFSQGSLSLRGHVELGAQTGSNTEGALLDLAGLMVPSSLPPEPLATTGDVAPGLHVQPVVRAGQW
jgi:hypothetical protein